MEMVVGVGVAEGVGVGGGRRDSCWCRRCTDGAVARSGLHCSFWGSIVIAAAGSCAHKDEEGQKEKRRFQHHRVTLIGTWLIRPGCLGDGRALVDPGAGLFEGGRRRR